MTHRKQSALAALITELSKLADRRLDTSEAMRRLLEAALQDLVDAQAGAVSTKCSRRPRCGI
ncbi:MAG: hypothetical protein LBJ08_04465 [Bifidobacteriaceae bacterium]|nr:hypothetical protein [Bifidobacteriaceae bacterium]